MASNINYNFVLERLHSTEIIMLNDCGSNYSCGRSKECTIVCCNPVVSRKHCVFIRDTENLYVSDLKSSNGVFVNGVRQDSMKMIKLNNNDIIGIGWCGTEDDDAKDIPNKYAYKLRVVQITTPDETKNRSTLGDTLTNNTLQTTNDDCSTRKRVHAKSFEMNPPAKIQKLDTTNKNSSLPAENGPSTSHQNKNIPFDDDDIEIVHVSDNLCETKPVIKTNPDANEEHGNVNRSSYISGSDVYANFNTSIKSERDPLPSCSNQYIASNVPSFNSNSNVQVFNDNRTNASGSTTVLNTNLDTRIKSEKDALPSCNNQDESSNFIRRKVDFNANVQRTSSNVENNLSNNSNEKICTDAITHIKVENDTVSPFNVQRVNENLVTTNVTNINGNNRTNSNNTNKGTYNDDVRIEEEIQIDEIKMENMKIEDDMNTEEIPLSKVPQASRNLTEPFQMVAKDQFQVSSSSCGNQNLGKENVNEKCNTNVDTEMICEPMDDVFVIEQHLQDISDSIDSWTTKLDSLSNRNSMLDVSHISSTALASSTPKHPTAPERLCNSYPTFIKTEDNVIKLEDELQIMDDNEDANKAATINKETAPTPSKEIVASTSKVTVPTTNTETVTTSPFKLKPIKQEPKTRFSENDIVTISDEEDDVFPCSQLFNDGFKSENVETKRESVETKSEVKEEIKEECFEENVFQLDDVVILSDDEDETDHRWLTRLSQSQSQSIIKEEIEIVDHAISTEPMNDLESPTTDEFDAFNMASECRLESNICRSDFDTAAQRPEVNIPLIPKLDFNEHEPEPMPPSPVGSDISKPDSEAQESEMILFEAQSDISKPESSCSETQSEISRPESEVTSSVPTKPKPKPKILKSCDIFKFKFEKPKPDSRPKPPGSKPDMEKTKTDFATASETSSPALSNESLHDRKMRELISKATKITHDGKSAKKIPEIEPPHMYKGRRRSDASKKDGEYSRSKSSSRSKEDGLNGKKSQLLSSSENLSKEERQLIVENRKEKLKTLAAEKKSSENEQQKLRRLAAKAKAKITVKNRGDFLAEDQVKSINIKPQSKKPKPKPQPVVPQNSEMEQNISQNAINNVIKPRPVEVSRNFEEPLTGQNFDHVEISNENQTIESTKRKSRVDTTSALGVSENFAQKENHSPNRLDEKNRNGKIKKKNVTFSRNMVSIRVYEIDPGNKMKKLQGKDAPMPKEKLAKSKINIKDTTKFEAFLQDIFHWNPVWLEEQRRTRVEPPLIRDSELRPMLTHYNSYDDYFKVMRPLLLLETWHRITKDYDAIERNPRRPTILFTIQPQSITRADIESANIQRSRLTLEILVSRDDLQKHKHPVLGDLIFLEFEQTINIKNKQHTFYKVFAYVTKTEQTILTPGITYNENLRKHVQNPFALIKCNVFTKVLEADKIMVNRVYRLRTVSYLRADLRMIQAFQYFPVSPLSDMILYPRVEEYQLPPVNSEQSTLVSKNQLNPKQLEAVLKVTEAVIRKEPKLCFIQGPPGTGKSTVIENIITQILYGDSRYQNKGSFKILLCAPSNAAIDELVVRLLRIRKKMTQDRFKMVRIGRPETMHPMAKEISVTTLASRDVKQTTELTAASTLENLTEEMAAWEAQINAHNTKLTSQMLSEAEKKCLRIKLDDMMARYNLLQSSKERINNVDPKVHASLQRAAETKILEHADIITCTLSSCYTNQMESIFGTKKSISVCIVDEATQSCEAETLIPLMLGINTMVLVGDPNQLPATIMSQRAKSLGLDQSLFSRIQSAFATHLDNPIIMLDTQYRMTPSISYWPNRYFYQGKLKNAFSGNSAFPFHSYRVLQHDSNQNKDKFTNTSEAEFVAKMITCMIQNAQSQKNLRQWKSLISIGVLTPYQNQRSLMMAKINEKLATIDSDMKKMVTIEVNTVDSFQGQERDVIIMSCVRSEGIGFLCDKQRLCVALTRAKHSLFLCGNFDTFLRDQMWRTLILDAKERKVFCNVKATVSVEKLKPYIVK